MGSMSWSVATMIGPSAGIFLYQAHPALLWVATLMVSLVAAGLMLASRPGFEKKGEARL